MCSHTVKNSFPFLYSVRHPYVASKKVGGGYGARVR